MRKVLIASAVALVLFATGAFAASFLVESEDIASGADDVVACAELVKVDFTTVYNEDADDWTIDVVELTFFADEAGTTAATLCDGFTANVVVEDEGNTEIGRGSALVAAGAASITLDNQVLANDVGAAAVLVDGKNITPLP